MYNWSTDEKRFKKKNPQKYQLWRLEQLINYGLDGEKLDREEVKKAWPSIKGNLDPYIEKGYRIFIMGKSILTAKQLNFLELVSKDKQITSRFYFTGGTVLAQFYLQHRLSEDIDLFTEKEEVNQSLVEAFLKKISLKFSIKEIKKSQFLGLFSYTLIFNDGEKLKVDFNYYPFPRINKGKKFKNLDVDSLYDIAVNKVHTMFMRTKSRDFIDLYYIMKTFDYSLDQLIKDSKIKFDWHIDKITLASQFVKVKELSDFPTMLVPFDQKDMEKFFLNLAKSLESGIFK